MLRVLTDRTDGAKEFVFDTPDNYGREGTVRSSLRKITVNQ